ncbi:zinc-ribbon domain-containing protein [Pseudoflavonifractor phocaeensis]|nr:zinc-ribbon domain-containing protein [Pseudoflavonifractor phocaeensis]
MYCSKCGSELAPDAAFCANCGSCVWKPHSMSNGSVQSQQSNPNPYGAAPDRAGQNEVSNRFSPPRPDNPTPYSGTPGSTGQNEVSSRFSPPRPDNPNPFGGMPGSAGQNEVSSRFSPPRPDNPNPFGGTPGSTGQNEVSSRFSPPRPGNPNPFGGMPGGMGQNHSYAPSVSQVEDSGYTRIFGYQRAVVILSVISDVIFVFFMWWLYVKIENRSYFGYYDDVLAFLMIIIIVCIMVSVYQNYQEVKTKIEVGPNGISGRGRSGKVLGWLRLGPTKDIMISYKDMDDVQTSIPKQLMSINNINITGYIKIFASGTWFYFHVENAKEAFDLIRQRWQAARR